MFNIELNKCTKQKCFFGAIFFQNIKNEFQREYHVPIILIFLKNKSQKFWHIFFWNLFVTFRFWFQFASIYLTIF
jgi:hypothetical protein